MTWVRRAEPPARPSHQCGLPVADRWRDGVTVVTTPRASSIGALLRAGDLHKGTLLEALERGDDPS